MKLLVTCTSRDGGTQEIAMHLSPTEAFAAFLAVVVVAAAIVTKVESWNRNSGLRLRVGGEYYRTPDRRATREARAELENRGQWAEKFKLRELTAAEQSLYAEQAREVQSLFVADPGGAVIEADDIVAALMVTRGYPMLEFDQGAADLLVDHSRVVEDYRAAHEIARRQNQGPVANEDLRRAMSYYRSLFEELLSKRSPRDVSEVA